MYIIGTFLKILYYINRAQKPYPIKDRAFLFEGDYCETQLRKNWFIHNVIISQWQYRICAKTC